MSPAERDEHATAAPRPVTVRGQTYLIAKSRPADFFTVGAWVLRHVRARSALSELLPDLAALPPDLQRFAVEKAIEQQFANGQPAGPKEPHVDFAEAFTALTSPEGCRFLFWIHARPNHPDLTLEQLVPLIDEANSAAVFQDLDEATGMLSLMAASGGGSRGNPPGQPS